MDPLDCIHSGNAAVMHAAPSITCSDSNPEFVKLRFISLLCLTVYGVGIPLLFLFVLWYYRKEIDVDQVLCTKTLLFYF